MLRGFHGILNMYKSQIDTEYFWLLPDGKLQRGIVTMHNGLRVAVGGVVEQPKGAKPLLRDEYEKAEAALLLPSRKDVELE